jgi:5-methylcytosine-specific restriction endonuclease McrA
MEEMSEEERWYAYGDENGNGPWNDDKDEDEDDEVSIIPCQNCDAALTPEQARHGTLFCSEKCQQTAKAIRYGRATLRDGRYQRDLDVRQAIDMRIAHILGGGYPEKARSLSDEQREAIFIRDNRRCCLCGAPATSIDHIAGSSPDPSNLQALCQPCNMAKARAHFRKATLEEAAEGKAIWVRIRATQPVRLCDDETKWSTVWREIASEQRKRARETGNH